MTKDFASKRYSTFSSAKEQNVKKKFKVKDILRLGQFLKQKTVSRMFWGRSSFYKNVTQFLMLGITVFIAVSGLSNRISVSASTNLAVGNEIVGSNDLLPQGGSIDTVLVSYAGGIGAIDHLVKSGETLNDIASLYKVTVDTIRWYNSDLISPFSNDIQEGWDLKIPAFEGQPINGVLYTVKAGQTLDDVVNITSSNNSESNISNIVEFNDLPKPYTLKEGQKLFIPDGNLINNNLQVTGIPRGVFINPLSNPECAGYSFSRGFTYYHDGVDLARWPGCPVEAVAAGTVIYAGWENLSGYCVKIDHGGGIQTNYYHAETVYVRVGQRVQQGDIIMKMGDTGNSTGTHLHMSLFKDHIAVDPAPYVPY